jgi:hypothetical protein
MFPSDDCDDCVPDYARSYLLMKPSAYTSYALFLATFIIAGLVAYRRILPKLSIDPSRRPSLHDGAAHLPLHSQDTSSAASSRPRSRRSAIAPSLSAKRIAHLTFAVNIGLSAVLIVLLLCEISNALDPTSRSHALKLVLPALTLVLVVIAPALELQSLIAASGLTFSALGKGRITMAWLFEAVGLTAWLFVFWYVGQEIIGHDTSNQGFTEGCLERVGATGIALMASLSGFVAISAVWQTFLVRKRIVTESDINRRRTGLEATEEMLETKRSRLRALEAKVADVSSRGVLDVVISTLRGSGDSQEISILSMEIKGLECMHMSIQDTLYLLRARKEEQDRRNTMSGRLFLAFSYAFASYCVVRLFSVAFNVFRRFLSSTGRLDGTNNTDPVTSILSILVNHWDPSLDRSVWTRQISFLLSGVMLFAAFNSALQTFMVLGRAFPGLAISAAAFRDATILALLISQVVATYVISAAFMLCSNLPKDVGSIIVDALGTPLESSRIDAWFEACFLCAAVFTTLGILAGNQLRDQDDRDGLGEIEMGKRS